MSDRVTDLLQFIDRSPTPYHAVAESVRRLSAAGFRPVAEEEVWNLEPRERRYVIRNESSVIAFHVGSRSPAEGGFHIVGAHTDSPNLRIKPRPDGSVEGYRQLAVEPYGGVLLHTWLDRDLSCAGRVSLRNAGDQGGPGTVLVDFERPLLRVPNLAIHLYREQREEGLKLNAQKHMVPVVGLEDAPPLNELLATELRARGQANVAPEDVLAYDLMLYDTQPSSVIGVRGEFVSAPRLDNLASCHAAVSALVAAAEASSDAAPAATQMIALYDHEEVGSRSAQGAGGTFLLSTLGRVVDAFKGGAVQGLDRAIARSRLVSADMAHAIHPNYSDRHEPGHRPVLGRGPVIKVNAGQSYASDAATAADFATLCDEVGILPQHFVVRSDMACGSTIGPITAARVGLRTVDVGNPMLSMHSCREMAGSADVAPMIDVLGAFFGRDLP